jgi:hypothetical protein
MVRSTDSWVTSSPTSARDSQPTSPAIDKSFGGFIISTASGHAGITATYRLLESYINPASASANAHTLSEGTISVIHKTSSQHHSSIKSRFAFHSIVSSTADHKDATDVLGAGNGEVEVCRLWRNPDFERCWQVVVPATLVIQQIDQDR